MTEAVTPAPADGAERSRPGFGYVLVHGGSMSARFWDRVVPLLDGPVVAPDLPGAEALPADPMRTTIAEAADVVVAAVDDAGFEQVVLVAHSAGGLVVPAVVERLAGRVEHIVLNAASVPPDGGCGLDCMKPHHRDLTRDAVAAARRDGRVITTPGPPKDLEPLRASYGGPPLSDDDLAFVADPQRLVRDTFNRFFEPVSWRAVGDVPITYLRNLRDGPVPLALQDAMLANLPHVTVVDLDAGHIPAITDPHLFAAAVHTAVTAVTASPAPTRHWADDATMPKS